MMLEIDCFFLSFFSTHGIYLIDFVAAIFVNGASGGFTADLLISSVVFWVYMFARPGGPKPWLFIAVNITIGLSCALPLYLFQQERLGGNSSDAVAQP